MNRFNSLLLLFAVIVGISFTSCKKYEDGPRISLASKKARLVHKWKLQTKLSNGLSMPIYDAEENYMEFLKDGKMIYSSSGVGVTSSSTWEFNSDKSGIILTSARAGSSLSDVITYTILRLKKDELWLEYNDVLSRTEYHYNAF